METKPSSVTDMVKRLAEKELLNYRKYQGVSLTDKGSRQALRIIRKHRLWEVFLVEKLDFDPHGDPIPDKNGQFKAREKKLLSSMPVNGVGICVGVKDSSAPFLKFLDKNQIALGQSIKILEKETFDQSMLIEIEKRSLQISHIIASNLFVKPIQDQ